MFAEFMFITLAVCLLLGTCQEACSAYGMSFGALLRAAVLIILPGLFRLLKFMKHLHVVFGIHSCQKSVNRHCIATCQPLVIHLLTTCNPHFWAKTTM